MFPSTAIIGAGIGGLTTALALQQQGCPVTVFEQAAAIRPMGAGIAMAGNAMQIFRELGLQTRIEQAGSRIAAMCLTDAQLKPLSTMELENFERRYGVCNVAIHRAALQQLLAAALGPEHIRCNKRLDRISAESPFLLHFSDASTAQYPVVIGADGIRSRVREQLFPAAVIRDTRQLCWRGQCPAGAAEAYRYKAIEAWGKGVRFGFVHISADTIYWYAVVSEHLAQGPGTDLADLFRSFHPVIRHLITATPEADVHFSRITDLAPIKSWQHEGLCLIGDAAHATTPNLGQGACQAVEDAYTLAQLIGSGWPVTEVFARYEQLRRPKALQIVRSSRQIGWVAHLENKLITSLRNGTMRLIPALVNNRRLDRIFDISYINRGSNRMD